MSELKNVKLTYFPFNGLALLPRMLLHYGKVPFENITITHEKWPELRPSTEFGFLPVLEVNGKQYSQSQAISVFIARKIGGLLGKDDDEEYQVMSILNCYNDLSPLLSKLFNQEEKDPEVIKTNFDNAIEIVQTILSALEKRYINNGLDKYFLGNKISFADFWLVSVPGSVILNGFPQLAGPARKAAPKLTSLIDRLMTEDPFKSFYESEYFVKNSM